MPGRFKDRPRLPFAGMRLGAALLVMALLGVGGCGRPAGEPGAPAETEAVNTAPAGAPAPGTYEDTGLPQRFELDGKQWEVQQDIEVPANSFEQGSEKVDGKPVYHEPGAQPPYNNIYLKVEGQDRFLQYAPARGE